MSASFLWNFNCGEGNETRPILLNVLSKLVLARAHARVCNCVSINRQVVRWRACAAVLV
jgi:hypothetical protein